MAKMELGNGSIFHERWNWNIMYHSWFSQQKRLRWKHCSHGTNHGHQKKVKCVSFDVSSMTSPHDCSIHVLQFNACSSVIANLNEIKSWILQDELQLVLIQEDWLNFSFGCKIPDYHWVHWSRTFKHASEKICGGGVSILVCCNSPFISFEWSCLHLPFLSEDLSMTDIMAVQFFHWNPTGSTVIDIINIYPLPITSYVYDSHTPSFNFQSLLHPLCEGNDQLPNDNHMILLCDNINSHSKLWDNHSPEDSIGKQITSFLLDYSFIIDNDGNPTYHACKCHMAPNITTHWWGDIIIDHWQRQEPIGKSHHNVLSYDIVMPFATLPSLTTPPTHSTHYSQPSWSQSNWIQFNACVTSNIL